MRNRKNSSYSLVLYLRWPLMLSILLIFMNLILLAVDRRAAAAMGVFTIIFVAVSFFLYLYSKRGIYTGLIDFTQSFGSAESRILNNLNDPIAICDTKGNLIWTNYSFETLFGGASLTASIQNIFPDITGQILGELTDDALIHSSYSDNRYLIEMHPEVISGDADETAGDDADNNEISGLFGSSDTQIILISVSDETELVQYKKDYVDKRPCEGLIYLDNYDEALASVEDTRRSLLTALVDRRISNYILSLNGIVKKLEKDKYLFFMNDIDAREMIRDRFSILEGIKGINIGNELSMTLSIGVGRGGNTYNECYDFAAAAIDLALGRGGDQAIVKDPENVTYFGGKSMAPEKNARVKARVKALAFRELLSANDKLLVMGHKNGDADSLGASIGIWKIAKSYGKTAHIVLNSPSKSLEPLYKLFANNPDYPDDLFISGDKALNIIDDTTIVTVVDVNRPSFTEEPRLLQSAATVVVIDHHRKGTEFIENAALTYVEPYASSACEMTTEIIQYIDDTTTVTPLEADALYSGMVIDTQNFINQTGVRTFESAAYLRRKGASTVRIRKLFRDNYNDFKAKAGAIDSSEIYKSVFAIGVLDPTGVASPTVTGAQAANSLLSVNGIKAAVVLTPYNDQIFVSARSIDEVNVQVMMERIGGGGHISVAGAQLKHMTIEEAKAEIFEVIDNMIEEGEIS
ncbi:MAG: DHH family phosphoesterase [Eubacteriales bacterium]|nr:DHH family phosphoesterase [Eubacteriales bacterium]